MRAVPSGLGLVYKRPDGYGSSYMPVVKDSTIAQQASKGKDIKKNSAKEDQPSLDDETNRDSVISSSAAIVEQPKDQKEDQPSLDDDETNRDSVISSSAAIVEQPKDKSCQKEDQPSLNADETNTDNVTSPSAAIVEQPKDQKEENKNPLKIKFAPFNVPIARRRQTLAVLINGMIPNMLLILFFAAWLNPFLWPVLIAYLVFMYFDDSPETGGRKLEWVRRLSLWKWYADYFPSRLIAEAKLDPQRNYIFGYHPHGILSMGAFSNFCTEATGVSDIFPGINIRVLTLHANFNFPFYREYFLSMGGASVSRKSINNILGSGPGNSCMIVVGGVEEVLEARPAAANLVLAHRYGFVRMAIKNGADLVPVFGFGENQLYDQADNDVGSWTRAIQSFLKKTIAFTVPLFYGRGVFNYNVGLLPHRKPLTVITGAPIRVEQNSNPSEEMVQAVHKQYLASLTDLYNRNKAAYWVGSEPPELTFI